MSASSDTKYKTLNFGGERSVKKVRGKGFYALVTVSAIAGAGAIATAITFLVLWLRNKKTSASVSTSHSTSTHAFQAPKPLPVVQQQQVQQKPTLKQVAIPEEIEESPEDIVAFGGEDELASFE